MCICLEISHAFLSYLEEVDRAFSKQAIGRVRPQQAIDRATPGPSNLKQKSIIEDFDNFWQ